MQFQENLRPIVLDILSSGFVKPGQVNSGC